VRVGWGAVRVGRGGRRKRSAGRVRPRVSGWSRSRNLDCSASGSGIPPDGGVGVRGGGGGGGPSSPPPSEESGGDSGGRKIIGRNASAMTTSRYANPR
jgi:hypothetical protein